MITNTLSGPGYLLKGFELLKNRRVRPFVIAPILINILLFISLTMAAINGFQEIMAWVTAKVDTLPAWLQWVGSLLWVLWLIFAALVLLVYAYTFTLISNLIGAPFYGLLAEKVEEVLRGNNNEEPMTAQRAMRIAVSAIKREFIKLGYFLPRSIGIGALILVLIWVPGINLLSFLAPVITFLWGGWNMALQYLDYPADNNEVSFSTLLRQAKQQRQQALGFGGLVLGATAVPILNLFAGPAAVAGGTAMWLDKYRLEALPTEA